MEKQTSIFDSIRQYVSWLRPATADVSRGPLKILVVDDEEPVRKFVDRVLRDAGYETFLAPDGPEALQVAKANAGIDVLLTDLMMPQMNGDELARRMRQQEPKVKVLYLTGYSDRLFKEKVMLWEDEAFLDKPCSVKGLLQAVSMVTFGRIEAPALTA